jgi:hypothetical protein
MFEDDDSGQFLLLTGVIVAVGLVVLLVFINQSSMSGYSSSESIMNFPKNDIRDFRAETINQAMQIATTENNIGTIDGATRQLNFSQTFNKSKEEVRQLYARRGAVVDVSFNTAINSTSVLAYQTIQNCTLYMSYTDGQTSYNETYLEVFG